MNYEVRRLVRYEILNVKQTENCVFLILGKAQSAKVFNTEGTVL